MKTIDKLSFVPLLALLLFAGSCEKDGGVFMRENDAIACDCTEQSISQNVLCDGEWVADCGDGLLVETSPERRLTIMKDSRLGSFGALALFFVLSTKVAALAALAGMAPLHALGACCLAGLLGRCQVFVGMRLPSARPGGLGSMMHDGMKPRYAYTALGLCLTACLVMGRHGLYGLLAAGLVAFRLLSAARKRIGGVTGDVFGALIETTECAVLAVCCLP